MFGNSGMIVNLGKLRSQTEVCQSGCEDNKRYSLGFSGSGEGLGDFLGSFFFLVRAKTRKVPKSPPPRIPAPI